MPSVPHMKVLLEVIGSGSNEEAAVLWEVLPVITPDKVRLDQVLASCFRADVCIDVNGF